MDPRNTYMLRLNSDSEAFSRQSPSVINTSTLVRKREVEPENDRQEEEEHCTRNWGRSMEARKKVQPGTELQQVARHRDSYVPLLPMGHMVIHFCFSLCLLFPSFSWYCSSVPFAPRTQLPFTASCLTSHAHLKPLEFLFPNSISWEWEPDWTGGIGSVIKYTGLLLL